MVALPMFFNAFCVVVLVKDAAESPWLRIIPTALFLVTIGLYFLVPLEAGSGSARAWLGGIQVALAVFFAFRYGLAYTASRKA